LTLVRTGSPRVLVVAALLAVQVFFGLHYIGAKIILAHIPPRAWATLRILSAAALILPATALAGKKWPRSAADHGRIALYAIFGVVINQVCFVEGLARTVASHSGVINTSIPVATLLIAILFGRERATIGKIAGIALSLSGVLYLIGHSGISMSGGVVAGDLLTLANALSYSFFLVISKPILSRHSTQAVTALLLGYGAVGITMVGGTQLARVDLRPVPAAVWGWAAFVVLFATVGAYMLNAWALKRVDSSLVALFIYIQPVIASTLSVALLGETITPHLIVSAILIFAGVFVALTARPVAPVPAEVTSK
jgi:drug/metabolite transporter (DMT)-like permease